MRMSRSDEELMDAVAHGDSRALGELVERYHALDYPFYFFDIRANAENRVARYLQEK
jgi:hypothetical protein